MNILFIDYETFNEVDIKVGTHRYCETAEAMLLGWAIDDRPAEVWDRTLSRQMPASLWAALIDPTVKLVAHKADFDRTVLHRVMGVETEVERWHCTMAQALAHSLPASLADLCEVFKLDVEVAKDKEGKKLIQLFCKPGRKGKRATRETHPLEWARFVNYCRLDIEAMRAVFRKLPRWNYRGFELASWHLDQRINERGLPVDTMLAHGAVRAIAVAQAELAFSVHADTGGEVADAKKVAQVRAFLLNTYGVALPDLTKATVAAALEGDLPEGARALLQARQQAGASSTSKYQALLNAVSWDGRLRGTAQWCGASRTGRWSGRIFQPQNLKRPTMKQADIDAGIELFKRDAANLVVDNVMDLASNTVRACMATNDSYRLAQSDLSNIEGRVAAWLAGERWKLQAFRDFDNKIGPDLYCLAYAKSFNVSASSVNKDQRQIGKVQELAMQYEGGVGAFATFALAYGIDLDEMASIAWPVMPEGLRGQAQIMLDWHNKHGRDPVNDNSMERQTWLACEGLKLGWRAVHPEIVKLWRVLKDAYARCVVRPDEPVPCGPLMTMVRHGAWLFVTLPSGRRLCYPHPTVKGDATDCEECLGLGSTEGEFCLACEGTGQIEGSSRLRYWGADPTTKRWSRQYTYGGSIFENITQAVARDVLAWAMPRVEAAGYPIVLTVHDEVVCETYNTGAFTHEELSYVLSQTPPWGEGLPLAAAGFEARNYRKE